MVQVLRAALGLASLRPRPSRVPGCASRSGRWSATAPISSSGRWPRVLDIDLGASAISGVPPDPQGLRSQLVLAVHAVLEALAQRAPVIVAIEDLHWADAASVELLIMLAELTDFHPRMVLVTGRPETEGNAWNFRQHVERHDGHRLTDLRLAALAEADSRSLAGTSATSTGTSSSTARKTSVARNLWLDERGTSGDLTDITVRCECGKFKALSAATKPDDVPLGYCNGPRPWLGQLQSASDAGEGREGLASIACWCGPPRTRTSLRRMSVISIPEPGGPVREAVEAVWQDFLQYAESLADVTKERRRQKVSARTQGLTDAEVWKEVERQTERIQASGARDSRGRGRDAALDSRRYRRGPSWRETSTLAAVKLTGSRSDAAPEPCRQSPPPSRSDRAGRFYAVRSICVGCQRRARTGRRTRSFVHRPDVAAGDREPRRRRVRGRQVGGHPGLAASGRRFKPENSNCAAASTHGERLTPMAPGCRLSACPM